MTRMINQQRNEVGSTLLTWYVEYEVVGAVELTGRVDGPTRVDAVVGRRHAHQLEPAV